MTEEEGPSFLEQLQEAIANDPDLRGCVTVYRYESPLKETDEVQP